MRRLAIAAAILVLLAGPAAARSRPHQPPQVEVDYALAVNGLVNVMFGGSGDGVTPYDIYVKVFREGGPTAWYQDNYGETITPDWHYNSTPAGGIHVEQFTSSLPAGQWYIELFVFDPISRVLVASTQYEFTK